MQAAVGASNFHFRFLFFLQLFSSMARSDVARKCLRGELFRPNAPDHGQIRHKASVNHITFYSNSARFVGKMALRALKFQLDLLRVWFSEIANIYQTFRICFPKFYRSFP